LNTQEEITMTIPTITADPTTDTITFDDVLHVLFPTRTGMLRLADVHDEHVAWHRHIGSEWWELSGEHVAPGFRRFLDSQRAQDVGFGAALVTAPARGAPLVPMAHLWAMLRLATAESRLSNVRAIIAEHEATVLARVASATLAPSLVIHGGDRIIPVWLLAEPLDAEAARPTLARINHRLSPAGVQRPDDCDAGRALFPIPQTRCTRVWPARVVDIQSWNPAARYTLADISAWLGGA
jgi:hypothetical protein